MRKKTKILFAVVGLVGLIGFATHTFAENYMCARPGGWLYTNYEEDVGGYCECDGSLQTGWAIDCDYVMQGGGDCQERTCTAAPCCTEQPDPN